MVMISPYFRPFFGFSKNNQGRDPLFLLNRTGGAVALVAPFTSHFSLLVESQLGAGWFRPLCAAFLKV